MDNEPTLLERERELQELRAAFGEAQVERGQFVLIEGPAGRGKTSLVRASLEAAMALGFRCLRARASELERDFPYGCVRQLLEPLVSRAAAAERERLFDGAAALAMPLFARTGIAPPDSSTDSAFAILHGLYWLLNNLARVQPVALCVDDLHWTDRESLRFLAYLAPRLDGLALAVVTTVRTQMNATADVALLYASPETKVLRPQPLSRAATAELCERRLDGKIDEDFVAACHGATGGNPFYLEMLLREAYELKFPTEGREAARVRRFGPAAVARAVLLRLSGAPLSATALVHAIAVLGDGASVTESARLAELPEDEAVRAADLLVTLSILKRGGGLEFAHPIVREAVYADIGAHARAQAHARAARILADGGASDERVATQLAQAEPNGEAARVGLLRRAAAGALMRGAPAAAVAWLKRALAEPPPPESRAEVLLELGSAELRLASPEAHEHLAAAMESLRAPHLIAFAARQLANSYGAQGNAEQSVAVLESAVAAIETKNAELALILEAELAAKAQQCGREARTRATARLARHSELAGSTPGERLVRASLAFERARTSESASDAARFIERSLESDVSVSEQQPDVVGPFYALIISLLATDALDVGIRHLDGALAVARGRASIPAIAFLTAHRGWFYLRSGMVAEAEADARATLDIMNAHNIQLGTRFAIALLVEALIENGEVNAAEQALRGNGLEGDIPAGLANILLLEARGALRIARGDVRGGLEDLVEYGRRDELWGAANPLASRWRSRACLALAASGDREQARRLAADDVERARRWGAASGIGIALHAAALVDADTGAAARPRAANSDASAIERLREAADILRSSPAKLEHARALTDLGAALRRANRRADARGAVQDALAIARSCGAGALVERANIEFSAAGGRSSDAAGSGAERLTVSERRVAELAAKGHSNPKIAQALFVTRKTVETHLGHIYAKLEISSRAELAAALARNGGRRPSGRC